MAMFFFPLLASADIFFGSQAVTALQYPWIVPGDEVEARRTVRLENFRSGNVAVYWVNAGEYTLLELLEPRSTSHQDTALNRTYAIMDALSNKLILTYVATGSSSDAAHVVIGEGTSCISHWSAAQTKKNAQLRSDPLLSAQQGEGSESLTRLKELARTNKELAPFAWSEIGRVLLLSSNKTIHPAGGETSEGEGGDTARASALPQDRVKQAAYYFYRAAMRGDGAAQWMMALLFWSGLLRSTDMQRLQLELGRESMPESMSDETPDPVVGPAVGAHASGDSSSGSSNNSGNRDGSIGDSMSGNRNSGGNAMLWPERIGTTWAQCASIGGSVSAKMSMAYRCV
jgi:hypothetical protein